MIKKDNKNGQQPNSDFQPKEAGWEKPIRNGRGFKRFETIKELLRNLQK